MEDLAKGQIGVTDTRMGVASAEGDYGALVSFHRLAGKLFQENRLAAASFSADKGDPTLPFQGPVEQTIQLCQLRLA